MIASDHPLDSLKSLIFLQRATVSLHERAPPRWSRGWGAPDACVGWVGAQSDCVRLRWQQHRADARSRSPSAAGRRRSRRRLDFEMIQLFAGLLHGRDKPSGLKAPTAPRLSLVGRIAILGLEFATSE